MRIYCYASMRLYDCTTIIVQCHLITVVHSSTLTLLYHICIVCHYYMEQGLYFLYPQKDTRYIHSPILKRNLIYTHQKQNKSPVSYLFLHYDTGLEPAFGPKITLDPAINPTTKIPKPPKPMNLVKPQTLAPNPEPPKP